MTPGDHPAPPPVPSAAPSAPVDPAVVDPAPPGHTVGHTLADHTVVESTVGDPAVRTPVDPAAARPAPTMWEQMGGPMGMLDSGLPVVVFVVVNAIGSLGWAIGAALLAGLVIAAVRLVRHKPVTQAVAGLFGVGLAAFIAYRTGSAKGYFLFGIWSFVVYGSALLLSILVRWPLIGVLWEGLNSRGSAWRSNRKLVRRYDYATAVWVVVFAARFGVQHQLYTANEVGWLATARLLMGYPVYLLAILVTVLIVGSASGMSLPSRAAMFKKKPSGSERAQRPT